MIVHNGTPTEMVQAALHASIELERQKKEVQTETRPESSNSTAAAVQALSQTGTQQLQHTGRFLPAMTIQQALTRRQAITDLMKHNVLKSGIDYGVIPGSSKPTLLKPGAERICSYFGLAPAYTTLSEELDWDGKAHDGEPFFYIKYKCSLYREGVLMGEGDGSCNSREVKYRYRQGERKCPSCNQPAIIAGKAEYGGGWVCFRKKGGCGAKFADADPAITAQQVGRVLNPDAADLVNTLQKMSQKRSFIAATLNATNASEFFTQDTEDALPVEVITPDPGTKSANPGTADIDTGGHPFGTRAAQEYVRDRKLAAAPPVMFPAGKPWKNRGEMVVVFNGLREKLGEVAYMEALDRYSVISPREFRSPEQALACWQYLAELAAKEVN